ncbi:MAG: spore coat protein U domain-containing protein [Thermodesulfobacteriota bacterium]
MKKIRIIMIMAAIAFTLSIGTKAMAAGPSTAPFLVNANIPALCTMQSADPIAFGAYDFTADSHASGDITFVCTPGTTWELYITTDHADTVTREMLGPQPATTDVLSYELYSEGTWTTVFPSTQGTALTAVAAAGPITVTVFGEIPLGQLGLLIGDYEQTATANVEYF